MSVRDLDSQQYGEHRDVVVEVSTGGWCLVNTVVPSGSSHCVQWGHGLLGRVRGQEMRKEVVGVTCTRPGQTTGLHYEQS